MIIHLYDNLWLWIKDKTIKIESLIFYNTFLPLVGHTYDNLRKANGRRMLNPIHSRFGRVGH